MNAYGEYLVFTNFRLIPPYLGWFDDSHSPTMCPARALALYATALFLHPSENVSKHTLDRRTWTLDTRHHRHEERSRKNECLAEMWSGSEEGSCLRLIDCCITKFQA